MPIALPTNTANSSTIKSTSTSAALRPLLSVSTFTRRTKSTDNVHANVESGVVGSGSGSRGAGGGGGSGGGGQTRTPISADERIQMLPQLIGNHHQRKAVVNATAATANDEPMNSMHSATNPQTSLLPPSGGGSGSGGAQNPYLVFQHIHDVASKRISTLDYLRKA